MATKITPIAIEDKMRDAYLNYSLSVIVSRALPDVRDGLKPVHRRILFAARELNLVHNKPYKKSARVVGEVLGKFHPHGDGAVYDAMVRMAQDFNLRYQLIDGQGNFGSIDGDSPAAMRYTEVRLTRLAEGLLTDINQDTVDFSDNFDGSLQEPIVLPSELPNLLINGTSGIAVGMSTDIPPHNLGEVIDGLLHLIKHPGTKLETLLKYIPGPDFPTGAEIIGDEGIIDAYRTGKGRIILRGKTKLEQQGRKKRIIITEIPYQLNKTRLIEEIAETVNNGKIDSISDLRDESDQEGLRIVLDLKTDVDTQLVLNRLYKYTSLQNSYRINMLALVGKKPEVMDLKTILQHFINFRREVITRRTKYRLVRAKRRYHILEGIIKAIDKMDLVIAIIRNSKSTEEASESLKHRLKITDEQTKAILEMQLQRLVRMETEKVYAELQKLAADLAYFEEILNNQFSLDELLQKELRQLKKDFNDSRKTLIIPDLEEAVLTKTDLVKEKEAVITFSYRQNIKRIASKNDVRTAKNDYLIQFTTGSSLDNLLIFTDLGNVYTLPVHKIPEHHGLSNGDSIKKYFKIPLNERVIKLICLNEERQKLFITIVTARGMIKKTIGQEYLTSYSNIKAINLNQGDRVVAVAVTDGQQEILLGTYHGQAIRFDEDSVSATGRYTQGNIGIKLIASDHVINMNIIGRDDYLISLSDSGRGKKTLLAEYKSQKRNGKGLKTCGSSIHKMVALLTAQASDQLLLTTSDERLCPVKVSALVETQRVGNMYRLLELNDSELISSVYKLPWPEENAENGDSK